MSIRASICPSAHHDDQFGAGSTAITDAAAAVVAPFRVRRADNEPEPTTDADAAPGRGAVAPPGPPTPDLPADPAAHRTAAWVLRVMVEILDGRRPVNQLDGLATPAVVRCVRFARHWVKERG